jgi:arylsulfatase A-like enzyme
MRLSNALTILVLLMISATAAAGERPNVIIIFADDLGYGDLGCYGSPTIRTPHLDQMASEGLRFTDFYSASEVCSPSRAALLTGRYTEDAVKFITEQKGQPFFLYFAHTFPHVPMFASPDFKGQSRAGIYGDAVEELDWSVGQVLATLRKAGIAENTLVVFTSDNGPWLIMGDQGGSAGLLREGKGSTWEGGMRVPAIAWMPGRIKPRVTSEVVHAMDLFPTALALAATPLPNDITLDGLDLGPLLFKFTPLPARPFFYYRGDQLFACRLGEWKAHFTTQNGYGQPNAESHDPPLLFHLGRDPSEKRNVASQNAEVLAQIADAVRTHQSGVVPGAPQLQ